MQHICTHQTLYLRICSTKQSLFVVTAVWALSSLVTLTLFVCKALHPCMLCAVWIGWMHYLMCATPLCTVGCPLAVWAVAHIVWSLRKETKRWIVSECVCGCVGGVCWADRVILCVTAAYMQVSCSLWCGGKLCTPSSCTWGWSIVGLEEEEEAACFNQPS